MWPIRGQYSPNYHPPQYPDNGYRPGPPGGNARPPPPGPAYQNPLKRSFSERHPQHYDLPMSLPGGHDQAVNAAANSTRSMVNRIPVPHSPGAQFRFPVLTQHHTNPQGPPLQRSLPDPRLGKQKRSTSWRRSPDEIDRQTELFTSAATQSPKLQQTSLPLLRPAPRKTTTPINVPNSGETMQAPKVQRPPEAPPQPSLEHERPVSETPKSPARASPSTEPSVSQAPPTPVQPLGDQNEPPPLREQVFEVYLKREEATLYIDYFESASKSMKRANQINDVNKLRTYTELVLLSDKSPFTSLSSIQLPKKLLSRNKDSSNIRALAQHIITETHLKGVEHVHMYPTTSFTAHTWEIPVWTHYRSSTRNMLVEGDKQRTFLPYLGDATDHDDDYEVLEEKIHQNQQKDRALNESEEFAKPWILKMDGILTDLGTSTSAVLRLLIDEAIQSPPKELPEKCVHMFEHREDWLTEGFYEEEDDVEATRADASPKPKRPQRQWRTALDNLPLPDERSLAAAVLACYVFMDVAGFSLWHVVRLTSTAAQVCQLDSPAIPEESVAYEARPPLYAYTDQACLMCKAQQCFFHGEFSEDEDGDETRIPMTSGYDLRAVYEKAEIARNSAVSPGNLDTSSLLGREQSGAITGSSWTLFDTEDPSIADDDFCSPTCFWDKSHRTTAAGNVPWSQEDSKMLENVGPAYTSSKRGPCILSRTGCIKRTCVEIFFKLVDMSPVPEIAEIMKEAEGHIRPNKQWKYWQENSRTWKHEEREPFRPCNHIGQCKGNRSCSCWNQGISCEKDCNCPSVCSRRFRGCRCHMMNKACVSTDICDCRALNRECDPDLCFSCGAHAVLDPVHRDDDKIGKNKCGNVSIQRGKPRKTELGQSKLLGDGGVLGWGLYVTEETRNGDYIGEYRGEIVTGEESEQRGIIYNAMNLSYLFDLNKKQVLDSTPIGNKLRYINHQGDDFANCQAKVMFCGGVQRIGMFATRRIGAGEELLFNYGDGFASKIDMVKKRKDGTVIVEKAKKGVEANTKTSAHKKLPYDIGRPPRRLVSKGPRKQGRHAELEHADGMLEANDEMDLDGEAEDEYSLDEEAAMVDDDVDENENEDEDEDEDEEVFEERSKKAPSKKTVTSSGITPSQRMQKAWISRYRNEGREAEAREQERRFKESLSKKRSRRGSV